MKIVSDKDLHVSTISGVAVHLDANVPRELSEGIAIECIKAGASIFVEEGQPAAAIPDEARLPRLKELKTPEEVEPPSRHERVVAAMTDLLNAGDPHNFRADGQPKSTILNSVLGFTVNAEEREQAWDALQKPSNQ